MIPPSIRIDPHPAKLLQSFLESHDYTQVAVLVDENTQQHCYPLIAAALPTHHVLTVSAGEPHKNLETCSLIWSHLTDLQFDRHGLVVILGGGVLGDMGGFCAATYKRGVDFVILPTTLLAQVDASVGGKLGIDFNQYKNHIGVFQEPKATLISSAFLETLPFRELRSGYAEIAKHCILSDREMWERIRVKPIGSQNWLELIHHSVAFKAGVVQRDPREKGERKILNFGHTIGHAIESLSLLTNNRLFHGEAVAAGMILEAEIACSKGLLSRGESDEIRVHLLEVYGKVKLPEFEKALSAMRQDKKNKGNKILMALPNGIGKAVWDMEASESEVQKAWDSYDSL